MIDTDDKIIQIIPAPVNMFVVYIDKETGEEFQDKIICLALTEDGDIQPLDTDENGVFEDARRMRNFKKVVLLTGE